MSRHADYRKLLEGPGYTSVVDVIGWRHPGWNGDPIRGWGDVNVGVIDSDLGVHYRSLSARISRAWSALRGEVWPFLYFASPTDVDDFVTALREAANVAFPLES